MTSMSALLGRLVTVLQAHPICRDVHVVEARAFSPDQFLFKIRAALSGQHRSQVRVYYNQRHIDYAYQVFTDVPLLHWDNKEEFDRLETYPHHRHDTEGRVHSAPLTGKPIQDIEIVLRAVESFWQE